MSLENDTQRQGEPTWEQMANRRNRESPSARNSKSQSGSGGGNRNGRQSGNFNNKKKRKKKDSDRWMNLFLILLLLAIIVLAVLYFSKDKDEPANPVPTGQAKPSEANPSGNHYAGANSNTDGGGICHSGANSHNPCADKGGGNTGCDSDTRADF